ncbi:MAG: hypothetical protein PV340_00460 [Wolbachia sp.]|nr:hypothetical protein [Wolbachia sp.]MDD9335939.1 hypothetical protein [Wolbachia sp.]
MLAWQSCYAVFARSEFYNFNRFGWYSAFILLLYGMFMQLWNTTRITARSIGQQEEGNFKFLDKSIIFPFKGGYYVTS